MALRLTSPSTRNTVHFLLRTSIPTAQPHVISAGRDLVRCQRLFRIRTMATAPTSSGRKYEWLVVIPDYPGVQQKRVEIRPQHFENMKPFVESGQWKMGGAILTEVPPDDEPSSLKFAGSTLITIAENKEEILDVLRNDVYAKHGVWDLDKVQMWPLKCAFRNP
ncbi:hypothetical protein VTK73DRAFT_6107 [Phialemonium thermophilum]|uniref:YCII-related domain-containing protein n=1 Tax=Phialemonium thermophilum TaxID=223376 RepID=A0ABR3WL05_9PEZI